MGARKKPARESVELLSRGPGCTSFITGTRRARRPRTRLIVPPALVACERVRLEEVDIDRVVFIILSVQRREDARHSGGYEASWGKGLDTNLDKGPGLEAAATRWWRTYQPGLGFRRPSSPSPSSSFELFVCRTDRPQRRARRAHATRTRVQLDLCCPLRS